VRAEGEAIEYIASIPFFGTGIASYNSEASSHYLDEAILDGKR
jgi:hypothetical protein